MAEIIPVGHLGDVHAPSEFGFDISDPSDAIKWASITGEIPIIADYSVQEAGLIAELVSKGHTLETAMQTVRYERIA